MKTTNQKPDPLTTGFDQIAVEQKVSIGRLEAEVRARTAERDRARSELAIADAANRQTMEQLTVLTGDFMKACALLAKVREAYLGSAPAHVSEIMEFLRDGRYQG
jgi:hypothetical protein